MTIPIDGTALMFQPDADMLPWWNEIKEERLAVRRCDGCDQIFFPPYPCCPKCGGTELGWEQSNGTGIIYSFTVVVSPVLAAFAPAAPYIVAVVELDEFENRDGAPVRMLGLVHEKEELISIGKRVKSTFAPIEGAPYPLPIWSLIERPSSIADHIAATREAPSA